MGINSPRCSRDFSLLINQHSHPPIHTCSCARGVYPDGYYPLGLFLASHVGSGILSGSFGSMAYGTHGECTRWIVLGLGCTAQTHDFICSLESLYRAVPTLGSTRNQPYFPYLLHSSQLRKHGWVSIHLPRCVGRTPPGVVRYRAIERVLFPAHCRVAQMALTAPVCGTVETATIVCSIPPGRLLGATLSCLIMTLMVAGLAS